MKRLSQIGICLVLLWSLTAGGQPILIDRGVRVEGLWCFPLVTDPKQFVYLPNQARLAQDESGQPQFSFLRYVVNAPGQTNDAASITRADGGGVLHFLVLYETPPGEVAAAQRALREKLNDKEVNLRGPIVFKEGRYALVSSVLTPGKSDPERKVLTTGHAPVLEGNRLAFSFDLRPEQTTLLLQSFAMKTPDVSLLFDMTFEGLGDAYDAELTIDWAEVRKSSGLSAGGSIYFISADVETLFDELRRKNAIRLRSRGADGAMEALLTTVYSKLLDLMFRRVEPERVPPGDRGGLTDALNAMVDPRGGLLSARKTTGFGIYAGYQLKEMKSSGTSVMNFNHRATMERHSFIAFNMGDLYTRYGKDPAYFRTINMADPAFQQREVRVRVDGALLADFDRYINSVTVTLRKVHQNGQETVRELALGRQDIKLEGPDLRMIYGWNGDEDRLAWLRYDYRTRWNFKGGGSYQTDWKGMDAPMIDLFAPYERRAVQLSAHPDFLRTNAALRAVTVQLDYDFFGEKRRPQTVVRPGQTGELPPIEMVLPLNKWDYDYLTTWIFEGGRRLTARGRDASGLVLIDELPKEGQAPAGEFPGSGTITNTNKN